MYLISIRYHLFIPQLQVFTFYNFNSTFITIKNNNNKGRKMSALRLNTEFRF